MIPAAVRPSAVRCFASKYVHPGRQIVIRVPEIFHLPIFPLMHPRQRHHLFRHLLTEYYASSESGNPCKVPNGMMRGKRLTLL